MAQRMLEAIGEIRLPLPSGEELQVTASIGIAQWNGQEGIQQLIERADQALYQATHRGRDRIELAQPSLKAGEND